MRALVCSSLCGRAPLDACSSSCVQDPRALDIERLPALVKALTMLGRAGGPVPPPAFMAALHSALQTYKELILRMRPLQDALREM